MRIAIVHPYPWHEVRRGGERYVADLAWYLAGAGHQVEVLTTAHRPVRTHDVRGAKLRAAVRLEHPWLRALGISAVQTHAVSSFPSLVRRRYDAVHALTPWAALAASLAGQRVAYTELGHPTRDELADAPGGLGLYRAALRRAREVTALSRSAAGAVQLAAGVETTVLPPGVRTDRFAPGDGERAHPPIVLFVSDATQWRKGVDLAIAAIAQLREEQVEVRLQLAGPGDHRWALDQLGHRADRELLAAIDVVGVGSPDDLPRRYATASVTVLPSTHEAFGLAVVESLACGTPVVCTAGWGMDDIVTDPAVGRRVEARDVGTLAPAIRAVLRQAELPATAPACRQHARRWDWAAEVGPAHEALYRRVAGR